MGKVIAMPEQAMAHFRVDPEDKSRALKYYRRFATDYEKESAPLVFKYFRKIQKRALLAMLDLPSRQSGRFLDIGCGGGTYSVFAKKLGYHVTAIDLVPEMLSRLEKHVDHTVLADLESMEVRDSFDVVLCAGVLDFVLDPTRCMHQLSRLVSDGGSLVLLVPCTGARGLFYRAEKSLYGIRVNQFSLPWLQSIGDRFGLKLLTYDHPLPTNLAVKFAKI